MRKRTSLIALIVTLLFSLAGGACKNNNQTTDNIQAPAHNKTAENKIEVNQDNSNAGSTAQEPNTIVNQFTNNVSLDKKPSTITLVKIQVTNAAANASSFHISPDGQVGASAAKVSPGRSTMLQTEVYQTSGRYPVALTISRNGTVLAVLNQNLNSSNVSVVITETAPNQFRAQWN